MRKIVYINIKNIIVDRHSISPETFNIALRIEMGYLDKNDLPPIKVVKNNDGGYILKDGRHRVTAFKLLGLEKIKAKYYEKKN